MIFSLQEIKAKHKSDLRNLEMRLVEVKDSEGDHLQKIDQLSKDNNELQYKVKQLQEDIEILSQAEQPQIQNQVIQIFG